MLNVVLFISKGILLFISKGISWRGKVILNPVFMNKNIIVMYPCLLNVWTVLFNINGKFCKYIGNVVCTYL